MTEPLPIEDAAARAQALDPARSFIVQAPAGSGKTELLVRRYLVLLARVDHPEEILAITFTNKAAGEMRDRVLKALASANAETPPAEPHKHETWKLARTVRARDADKGWGIEQNPKRLRVQTIDALCLLLARQLPLSAGFGAVPAVVEDAHELYRLAARETIALLETGEHWTGAVERLLRHLDNDIGKIEELLARMLARRDQWLRHVTGGRNQPRFADGIEARATGQGWPACGFERQALEAALGRVIADALADAADAVPRTEAGEIAALADHAAANLARDGSHSPLVACRGLAGLPGRHADSLTVWQGLAEMLLTKDGEWRVKIDKKTGFAAPSSVKNPQEKAALEAVKTRLKELIERLGERPGVRERLHALRQLPAPTYGDGQWAMLEALVQLLPVAAAQLTVIFAGHGGVDFPAVAHGALAALGAAGEPSELALKLDYRLRHVLVDEFQDTSLSQYLLLERLTAGWEENDGRTLFAVGDPMQSIYRFREADVGLYLRARREGIGSVRLTPLSLTMNFRSQAGVVAWVNAAFACVLPAVEDMTFGAVPYTGASAHQPALPGAAVTVHPLLTDDRRAEAQAVVEIVRQARAQDPEGSIAVLVRSRSHLEEIVPCLRDAGFACQAIDIEPLGHRQTVQDLLALTRALEHPADRLAWLAVLRAPWCGLTLVDLHALTGEDDDGAVWERAREPARLARLSADGRARLERVRGAIEGALRERQRLPLRRAVEGLWLALCGPACVAERVDLDDADVYFRLLDDLEAAGGMHEFGALEREVEKLFALPIPVNEPGTVQLMTMHKAKGLEFDTVIVPGLGRRPRQDDPALLLWAERPLHRRDGTPGEADLLLTPIRAAGEDKDPIYDYLKRLDAERGRLEGGRLLYVATTRAKKRLHLLGHAKVNDKGDLGEPDAASLLRTLWPAVREHFAQENHRRAAGTGTASVATVAAADVLSRRLAADWQLPPASVLAVARPASVAEETPVEFDWAGEAARHVGTLVHRYLLRIAHEGAARWTDARIEGLRPAFERQLIALGVARHDRLAAVGQVVQALTNALHDPRGRWLLDSGHEAAHSEYALSGLVDGRVVTNILDRTFVDADGTRWIVDYKTGAHTGGGREEFLDREQLRYAPQLARYAKLIARLDSRPVKLGLYFPMLPGWREWPV
jgi:ATP-dependent exoDNAse (exonuclease V) beta subunit